MEKAVTMGNMMLQESGAAYKIYDVWEPDYPFLYFYIGEWENGVREGIGDWFNIQRAQYQCNWVNDMPEGEITWYEEGYEGYYIYCWKGDVIHGLFDGTLSGTWQKIMRHQYF